MREIKAEDITRTIANLFEHSCHYLPQDVLAALKQAREKEESAVARNVLDRILENCEIAAAEQIPLCQDTGAAVIMLELGQEVHIVGNDLYTAVNEGVRQGYVNGYLRKSIVRQPFSERMNTKDNTPAMIYTDIVPGDRLRITVMPKGGGSENMSRLTVLSPSQGRQGIIDFVVNRVDEAGSNPCPPVIVGVGIGGTAEKTMMLAKRALLRKVGEPNRDAEVAALEKEILRRVNNLGIGAMGYGGTITALAVHVETFPCHIASLPIAVNLQCWCARHEEAIL
ncbi:MAG: fumarate hydratase [Chloroflexi bacterium CG15_BIG_FIL_POST_REV_8_21_14_020_46_15]|nr:MAG: fumarate hydratase [Chloroflexi bacterium CG15_BIG_FIL_POST_REV_8_21_14_020_46_15]